MANYTKFYWRSLGTVKARPNYCSRCWLLAGIASVTPASAIIDNSRSLSRWPRTLWTPRLARSDCSMAATKIPCTKGCWLNAPDAHGMRALGVHPQQFRECPSGPRPWQSMPDQRPSRSTVTTPETKSLNGRLHRDGGILMNCVRT